MNVSSWRLSVLCIQTMSCHEMCSCGSQDLRKWWYPSMGSGDDKTTTRMTGLEPCWPVTWCRRSRRVAGLPVPPTVSPCQWLSHQSDSIFRLMRCRIVGRPWGQFCKKDHKCDIAFGSARRPVIYALHTVEPRHSVTHGNVQKRCQ